jgi:hypothetical protein
MDDTTRNMVDLRNEIEHLTADNERLREQLAAARAALRDIATRRTGIGGAVNVDARTLRYIAKCALGGRWNPSQQ